MANLTTKTFAQLVSDQVTAIQGAARTLIDFTIGSILRSIVESNSAVALWVQGLILQLLATTRAATSTGKDLDDWAADFNFFRLVAVAASGQVVFSRFTATQAAFIPVGTQIQTSDASPETFAVIADTTNANWNAASNGYNVPAGTVSVSVPVLATVAGAIGNVLAGQCNVLTSSIPGVDTVANAVAFVNGANAEADGAFRTRFVAYISSLSKATKSAIATAITSVQSGVSYTLNENVDYSGAVKFGYFFVVVDDGSGTPSSGFLASISNAIDTVRGFTINFGVFAPALVTANVSMTVASIYHASDAALAQSAINAYIAALGIGVTLPYSRLAQIAYDASPTITNVTAVTLNSVTADLTATSKQRIMPGTITVN